MHNLYKRFLFLNSEKNYLFDCYFKEKDGKVTLLNSLKKAEESEMVIHKDDCPAIIIYEYNLKGQRKIICDFYYRKGKLLHLKRYDYNGYDKITRVYQQYYKNSELHRDDGPANFISIENKNFHEEWFIEGKMIESSF